MVSVNQTTVFAGHIKPDSLSPDIVYYYVVCFSSSSSSAGFNNKTIHININSQTLIKYLAIFNLKRFVLY